MKNRKCKIFHLKWFTGININNESPIGRKLTIHSETSNGEYECNLEKKYVPYWATFDVNFSTCDNTSLWNWSCLLFMNKLYESWPWETVRIDISSHVWEVAMVCYFVVQIMWMEFWFWKAFFWKFVNIGKSIPKYI